MKYKCLSISGFDGSGGAGMQADLKTFSALGCYAMSVLTALPIQNTCGVKSSYAIPVASVGEQLTAIFEDIMPNAIKIGMLANVAIVDEVANFLERHAVGIPIVLDPVMMAKSGDPLISIEAIDLLKTRLIPLVSVLTPNLPEARALLGDDSLGQEQLAHKLLSLSSTSVLVKGGHLESDYSSDCFVGSQTQTTWLQQRRIKTKNTHGTGCTLSAAICAGLARGLSSLEACRMAKRYVTEALSAAARTSVGEGHGPVHHFYRLWSSVESFFEEG